MDISKSSINTKDKKLNKGCLWLLVINIVLCTSLGILLIVINSNKPIENTSNTTIVQKTPEKIDYQQLLKDNTRTLNAGEYYFEDVFKNSSFFKVKPVNPKTNGNLAIYDAQDNLITNEIIGDGTFGIKDCITILDEGFKINISGIDRVMFYPVITGGVLPIYENKTLSPGYHSVGHTVAAGKYTISPTKSSSGNYIVYRGNSIQANEILGGDVGVKSYYMELQDGDLIYTSGVYINLIIDIKNN